MVMKAMGKDVLPTHHQCLRGYFDDLRGQMSVRWPDVCCSRGGGRRRPSDRMASTCCSVEDDKTSSAGLTGRDGPGRACLAPGKGTEASIKQRGFRIREVGFFSPYYDTIGGMLFDDAVDSGRVRLDALLRP